MEQSGPLKKKFGDRWYIALESVSTTKKLKNNEKVGSKRRIRGNARFVLGSFLY